MGNIEFYTYCPGEGVVKIHFAGIPPLGSTSEGNRILIPIACRKTRPLTTSQLPDKLERIYSYRPFYMLLIPRGGIAVNMSIYKYCWEGGWWWSWREFRERSVVFKSSRFPSWNAPIIQEEWRFIPNLKFSTCRFENLPYRRTFYEIYDPSSAVRLHVILVIYKASQSRFLYSEYFVQSPKWRQTSFRSIQEVMRYWNEAKETLLLFHDTAIDNEMHPIYPHPFSRLFDGYENLRRILRVFNDEYSKAVWVGSIPAGSTSYLYDDRVFSIKFAVDDHSRDAMAILIP